jgi:DNA-binding NarL/FixJ family response regulator
VWTRIAPGRVSGGAQWSALALGVLLVGAGLFALTATGLGLRSTLSPAGVAVLLIVGVSPITMPWIASLYRELIAERQEMIRSQTRVELATQVHDSVLQTLTLIRRHADDPQQVNRLARAEKRHLRSWLYSPAGDPDQTLSAALAAVAATVEGQYPVTVDVVGVTKDITAEGLATAIRQVHVGDVVFSPRLAGFVLDSFTGSSAQCDDENDRLTTRERDLMRLMARGYTYREAADELFVSVKTVEAHMSAVLRKLQLSNRRARARWVRGRGID